MRYKKESNGGIKFIILLVVIIILIVSFKLTANRNKEPNTDIENNPNTTEQQKNNTNEDKDSKQKTELDTTSDEENTPDTKEEVIEPTQEEKEDKKENKEIIPVTNIAQYRLYDTKVIASEETKYNTAGYKYFITSNRDGFMFYLTSKLFSSLEDDKVSEFDTFNKTVIESAKNTFDSDFFKENYLIFVVDYNINNAVSATVEKTEYDPETKNVLITLKRDSSAKDKSYFSTYLVPVEAKEISTVSFEYAN